MEVLFQKKWMKKGELSERSSVSKAKKLPSRQKKLETPEESKQGFSLDGLMGFCRNHAKL